MHTHKQTNRFSLREARLLREQGAPPEQQQPIPSPERPPMQNASDVQNVSNTEVHHMQDQFNALAKMGWVGSLLAAFLRHGIQPASIQQTALNNKQGAQLPPPLLQGIAVEQQAPTKQGKVPKSNNQGQVMPFMNAIPDTEQQNPPRRLQGTVTQVPDQTQTVSESAERFRAGDIVILPNGSVWEKTQTGGWTSLLEDYNGSERTDDGMSGAIRLPPAEQALVREAVRTGMRNKTFLDVDGKEWYCQHAGQLHELSPRYDSIDVTKNATGGATMYLQASEQLTFLDWRGIVRLPGTSEPLLGQQPNASATVDGVTYTRTRYGLQAVAGPDARGGRRQIWMLNKYITIDVKDAATETVDVGNLRTVEIGKTEWVRISPPQATVRIPAGDMSSPGNTIDVPQANSTPVENNYYRVQRYNGYVQITGKAKPPQGVQPSFTVSGSNSVTRNFDIIDMQPKLSMPGTLEQGAEHTVGQVEPKTAVLQIVPMNGGSPVQFLPNGTVTLEGVTYTRRASYGSAAHDWITTTAATGAPVGARVIRFASGTPTHTMQITPRVERPTTPSYTPPAESAEARAARIEASGRRVDSTLADPADFETHSGGPERIRVPAGTIRILDTGIAFVKNGEGHEGSNRFTGWTSVPRETTLPTYNHEHIRQHSAAQIAVADATAARSPSVGALVNDTRGNRWEYKATTEGNRWRRVS